MRSLRPILISLLTMLCATPLVAQLTVQHYAGSTAGPGSDDGPALAARVNRPTGVAVDASGNVFIADFGNHVIRRRSSSGEVTTVAGLAGVSGSANGRGGAARFHGPGSIALDGSGNLYVADRTGHAIRKVTPSGVVSTVVAGLSNPSGVALGPNGAIYFTEATHRVRKYEGGTVTTVAGTGTGGAVDGPAASASFFVPEALAVDANGVVYVADYLNGRIRKIDSGTVSTFAFINNPVGVVLGSSGQLYVTSANHFVATVSPSGTSSILAGTSNFVGDADGTGSAARFSTPAELAIDASGNLYVADDGNHLLRRISPSGVVTTILGATGREGSANGTVDVARFKWPRGIAADLSGNLFVADAANQTIRKVDAFGNVTTFAGSPGLSGNADGAGTAARFTAPWGVATDSAGNVYVGDESNSRLRKISPSGVVTTLAGSTAGYLDGAGTAARFYGPRGVAIDASGNVFVADNVNHVIRKVTPAGEVTTLAGTPGVSGVVDGTGSAARFHGPTGLAVDSSGNVYVTDGSGHAVRMVTPAGVVTTLAGPGFGSADGPGSAARFAGPTGVVWDAASGNLYVTDQQNHTLRRITPAGVVSTVAGVAGQSGGVDGTGSAARLAHPYGIGIDANGRLYVADTQCRIRKVSPAIADAAIVDAASGLTGVARTLDTNPQTATDWRWTMVRRPATSSSTALSSTSIRNPGFTPDTPDVYRFRVEASSAAGASITSVDFTALCNAPAPTITASGPTTFCQGGSVTLTSSSAASYLWSNGATTQSITVNASGSYSVTTTDDAGCSATSAVTTVTVNNPPASSISVTTPPGSYGALTPATQALAAEPLSDGGTYTFCGPTTRRLIVQPLGSSYTYLWSTGATAPFIDVTTSGVYAVTVTDANGCSDHSTVTISINPTPAQPTITASGSTAICQNGGSVTLTSSAGDSYVWSNGATTQSITVTQAGSYSVRVFVNGCSSIFSMPTEVTYDSSTITASGPTELCPNGGSVTLTANSGDSYLWSNGATTQSIVVTAAGSYSVTVTRGGCALPTSAPVTVTHKTASISPAGPVTLCADTLLELTASPGASYLWSNGATTRSTMVSEPGTYTVTVTDSTGCAITASVSVVANPTSVTVTPDKSSYCTNESMTLTSSITGGTPQSYQWYGFGGQPISGATSPTLTVPAGSSSYYFLRVLDERGCSVRSNVYVPTIANPTVSVALSGAAAFCQGGSVTLTASSGFATYAWSDGATTQSITVSASGTFTVTASNANGCTATSEPVTVTVNDTPSTPVITASGPTTFCAGGSVTLTAPAGYSYAWSTGATTQSIVANASGNYSVTVTNANGCSATSAPTTVTVNANPSTPAITASGPTTFCAGGSVTLTAPAGYTYLWSTGATTQSIVANASGNYSVTITNPSGCSATSAPTTVTVNQPPTVSGPTPSSQTVRKNQAPTTLSVTAPAGSTYQWFAGSPGTAITGATSSTYVPSTVNRGTFTYWVRVTGANGCVTNSSVATVVVN